ncbi:MAG: hypothetical protein NTY11_00855 [Candidatus Parcubacteria bacterium]|nr:hypothetical protein [Candidatus Parcubacteria bacterium]
MPKINIKINTEKIRKALRRILWFLGQRAFISFLTLFFISLFIGGVIFYYYGFLVITHNPEAKPQEISLDSKLYQQFLDNYRQRKVNFDNADSKIYFNPFFHKNIEEKK